MKVNWIAVLGASAVALGLGTSTLHAQSPATNARQSTPAAMSSGMMGGGMMGGSGAAPDENRADLTSRVGREFAETCARCHALPDARQHTAVQWPAVVERMHRYAQQAQLPFPDAREVKKIDSFLASHASDAR